MTPISRRMCRYCLLERCLEFSEPALLCGETGTGKTTVCQMAAFVRGQRLHIINCNQHTEVSDFLGGFRPNRCASRHAGWSAAVRTGLGKEQSIQQRRFSSSCRHRDRSLVQLQQAVAAINASPLLAGAGQPALPLPSTPAHAALQEVVAGGRQCLEAAAQLVRQSSAAGEQGEQTRQLEQLRAAVSSLAEAVAGIRAPFEWADGPLVQVGQPSWRRCVCLMWAFVLVPDVWHMPCCPCAGHALRRYDPRGRAEPGRGRCAGAAQQVNRLCAVPV